MLFLLAGPALLALAQTPAADVQSELTLAREAMQRQAWGEATSHMKKVVELDPQSADGWQLLGYCCHMDGKLEEALKYHLKATEFPRTKPIGLYNMGCAYALLGRKDEAFKALKDALDAGFGLGQYLNTDSDLDSLRDDPRFKELAAAVKDSVPPPQGADAERGRLDFWVGDWDLLDKDGQVVGQDHLEKAEKGFVIIEHWTLTNGNGGRGMSYYDPTVDMWKQLFVSNSGKIVQLEGEFRDGAMRFRGKSIATDGKTSRVRSTVTPKGDGMVNQVSEISNDDGQTWTVSHETVYRPRKSTAAAAIK